MILSRFLNATAAKILCLGRMDSVVFSDLSSEEYCRERASALTFLVPGMYERTKLNLEKNNDQRAWRGPKRRAFSMYNKFLWSVRMVKGSFDPSKRCLHS
ncbi:hypothetical protein FKM82_024122 [Ascaphus truei]